MAAYRQVYDSRHLFAKDFLCFERRWRPMGRYAAALISYSTIVACDNYDVIFLVIGQGVWIMWGDRRLSSPIDKASRR